MADAQYLVTFAVMLLVALVISHLASMMRQQAEIAHLQERQAAAMHGLSRQLASARGTEKVLLVAVKYLSEIFDCQVAVLLPDARGKLGVSAGDPSSVLQKDILRELEVARSAYEGGQMSGWGIQNSPPTEILCVPLQAGDSPMGVLALRPENPQRLLLPEQLNLLESLAKQIALSLEVERLAGNGISRST